MSTQVEIIIRGVSKLSAKQQSEIADWIKSRGVQFKREDTAKLTNRFTYCLVRVEDGGRDRG